MNETIRRTVLLVCCLFALIGFLFTHCEAQSAKIDRIVDTATAKKWQEDLRYLARELPKRHKDLFHAMTREQFEAAVKNLDERIPNLSQEQIIVELQRIVAMIRDGHTRIQDFPFGSKIGQ
jgi:hypothetical protein